jgi:hypothetical protein
MLPLSLCRLWQPDQAANAAQDTRSYTTARGTISLGWFGHVQLSNPPHVRGESELNFSIETRSGSRRCRRLRPMNNDGPWHRRTGSRGPDRYRIVFGCRLRETACQYRFRWRSLVWPHRSGDGRRCYRLKPSARYKPSRRGPFISSVGRGRRGQAAHYCCHGGC